MRIGQGYDVHRLVKGRPLIIGGVTIPHERGLDGHSDADVLLHAICDALLGAIGAGDIGQHFPNTDPAYKDADSRQLLREVCSMVREAGFELGNLDATIIAEQPRLAPFLRHMQSNVAHDLGVDDTRINIKATTTEGLGFEGSEQGIAASAIVICLPS
jgi:2-C-methyl-D-erythritol 2,4-cyclodiphosphate synthase